MVNTTSAFRFSFPPLVPLLLLPLLLPIILFRLGLLHHEDFAWRLSDNGHSLIQYLYFFSHTPPDPRVGNDDTIRGANVGSTPTLTSFTSPIPSTRLRPRSFRVYGIMGSLLTSVPPLRALFCVLQDVFSLSFQKLPKLRFGEVAILSVFQDLVARPLSHRV